MWGRSLSIGQQFIHRFSSAGGDQCSKRGNRLKPSLVVATTTIPVRIFKICANPCKPPTEAAILKTTFCFDFRRFVIERHQRNLSRFDEVRSNPLPSTVR